MKTEIKKKELRNFHQDCPFLIYILQILVLACDAMRSHKRWQR